MVDPFVSVRDALADRYRIGREIGAGGMATVYLAEDLKHDRQVAIKVLNPEVSRSVGRERFLREVRIAAKFAHPHILPLFDSGDADGNLYYVMPYVEGETLRRRLGRGALPVPEALEMASEVASALEYAHRRGVVHRDVKPENVMLGEGGAMVADFGIALAVSDAADHRLTMQGHPIGTPAYMSPEQIAAGDVDHRSDIYSLGAVVYETLTGKPLHHGDTYSAIVASVVAGSVPDIRMIRDEVPPAVGAALMKALAKIPDERYPSVAAFAHDLELMRPVGPPVTTRVRALGWAAAVVVVVGVVLAVVRALLPPLAPTGPDDRQLTVSGDARAPALSPDGGTVAFVGANGTSLVVQDADDGAALTLVTDIAQMMSPPRWTANGQQIVFHAVLGGQRGLYAMPWLGGTPRSIDTGDVRYVDRLPGPDRYVIASSTGEVRTLDGADASAPFDLGPDITWLWNMRASPDGRRLAFVGERPDGRAAIGVVDLDGRRQRILLQGGAELLPAAQGLSTNTLPLPQVIEWEPRGQTVYVRRSTGRGADLLRIGAAGRAAPVPVVQGLPAGVSIDVSADGRRLAYAGGTTRTQLVLLRRQSADGTYAVVRTLTEGSVEHLNPVLTADGRTVFYRRIAASSSELMAQDLTSNTVRRLLPRTGSMRLFGVAPTGDGLAFVEERTDGVALTVSTGQGPTRVVSTAARRHARPTWTPDGRSLLFPRGDARNLLLLELGTGAERMLLSDVAPGQVVTGAVVSPDGRMAAFRRYGDGSGGVWTTPLNGGPATPLTDEDAMPLAWRDDGSILVLRLDGRGDWWGTEIRLVHLDGRPEISYGRFPFRCHFLNTAVTPDGDTAVCSVSRVESDVWLVDDFESAQR